MVHHSTQILAVDDGHKIQTRLWQPDGDCAAIIQVVHGLGEYTDRYARFAEAAVRRGFAVCAHDHRGHGSHAEHPGYFAVTKGWDRVVNDVDVVNAFVRRTVPGVPVVLLGHSMGVLHCAELRDVPQRSPCRHDPECIDMAGEGETAARFRHCAYRSLATRCQRQQPFVAQTGL